MKKRLFSMLTAVAALCICSCQGYDTPVIEPANFVGSYYVQANSFMSISNNETDHSFPLYSSNSFEVYEDRDILYIQLPLPVPMFPEIAICKEDLKEVSNNSNIFGNSSKIFRYQTPTTLVEFTLNPNDKQHNKICVKLTETATESEIYMSFYGATNTLPYQGVPALLPSGTEFNMALNAYIEWLEDEHWRDIEDNQPRHIVFRANQKLSDFESEEYTYPLSIYYGEGGTIWLSWDDETKTIFVNTDGTEFIANKDCSYMFAGFKKIEAYNEDGGMEPEMSFYIPQNIRRIYNMYKNGIPTDKIHDRMLIWANNYNVSTSSLEFNKAESLAELVLRYGYQLNLDQLETIDFGNNFNTSCVSSMAFMFAGTNLREIDLSKFNTDFLGKLNQFVNYTYGLEGMFAGCSNLSKINLSGFNTQNVTTMRKMFAYCTKLTSLNVASFDTYNVFNMAMMFYHCEAIKDLNLSNFDLRNATILKGVFAYTYNLKNFYIGNNFYIEKGITNLADDAIDPFKFFGGNNSSVNIYYTNNETRLQFKAFDLLSDSKFSWVSQF